MLSARPWKLEAVIRLVFSVFVCFCAGYLISVALPVLSAGKLAVKLLVLDGLGLICLAAALILSRRPWGAGDSGRRVAILLVCAYSGMLLGLWAQHLAGRGGAGVSTGQMLVALASFQGALLAFVPGFLREHEARPVEAFGLANRWPQALAFGTLAACLFYPISQLILQATAWLMQHLPFFPMRPVEQAAVNTIRSAPSWYGRLALGAATVVLAPVAEEVLFRGIIYTWIKNLGFPQLAIWGTSLLFAIMHFNVQGIPALFLLALILTLLYEKTGNLLAPIAAHSLFNGLNLAELYRIDFLIHHQPY
jgi:membrane protease YdiL (CAAX protease family)